MKDDVLHAVFVQNASANIGGHGVCQMRQGTTLYEVCGACVLMRPCPTEHHEAKELVPFNEDFPGLPCFCPKDVTAFLPENAIVPWRIDLTQKQLTSLLDSRMYILPMCTGASIIDEPCLSVVENDVLDGSTFFVRDVLTVSSSSGNTDWTKYLPRCFYCMPRFIEQLDKRIRSQLLAMTSRITISTVGKVLTIVFVGDSAMLYMALSRVIKRSFGDRPKLVHDKIAWTLSGWEDDTKSYAELRKGDTMKEPNLQPPPFTMRKTAFSAAKEEPRTEPVSSAVEPVVQEEPKSQPVAENQEVPVVEKEHETASEQPVQKRTRTRKAPTEVKKCNFDSIIELLGAPVQDLAPKQIDAAIEEIRGIRDLQIAATRRMANLALAIHKTIGASSAVLEEVRTLLAGK